MRYCYDCMYCIKGDVAEDSICDRPNEDTAFDLVTGERISPTIYCYDERYKGDCKEEGIYFVTKE